MVINKRVSVQTKGGGHIIDVTSMAAQAVTESGVRDGLVTLFVPGSTAGVTTIEYESGLLADVQRLFDQVAPPDADYRHNLRWGDGNGHSHVRASLLGPSLTVPFADQSLTLGTWQQIVLIDFDVRPRRRDLVLQVMGE